MPAGCFPGTRGIQYSSISGLGLKLRWRYPDDAFEGSREVAGIDEAKDCGAFRGSENGRDSARLGGVLEILVGSQRTTRALDPTAVLAILNSHIDCI